MNGVNIALNSPLAFPIETAISEIINKTRGSNVLNVSTGEEKKYFSPSSEKIFLTVIADVSKLLLVILVTSPSTPKREQMVLITIINRVKIIIVMTGPSRFLFFFFMIILLNN